MNCNELKAFCRENGIKGYSAKKKEDNIKLIQESTIDTETVEEKKESLVLKSDVNLFYYRRTYARYHRDACPDIDAAQHSF